MLAPYTTGANAPATNLLFVVAQQCAFFNHSFPVLCMKQLYVILNLAAHLKTTLRGDIAMSERKIMSLALKILGFYCIIQAVYFFQAFISAIAMGLGGYDIHFQFLMHLESIAAMIFFALFAYLLIKYSARWSERLYPSDGEFDIADRSPQSGWYELALAIMGIILLIRILPICILHLVTAVFYNIPEIFESDIHTEFGKYVIMSDRRNLVELIVSSIVVSGGGLYLVFWSKGLARFIFKMRNKTSESAR